MRRIATPNARNGRFQGGDSRTGVNATELSPNWCNDVQDTVLNPIEAAGIAPGPEADQLARAIRIFAAAAADRPGSDAFYTGAAGARIISGRVTDDAPDWIEFIQARQLSNPLQPTLRGRVLGADVPLVVSSNGRQATIDTNAEFELEPIIGGPVASDIYRGRVEASVTPGNRIGEADYVTDGAAGRIPLTNIGSYVAGLEGNLVCLRFQTNSVRPIGIMGSDALLNVRQGWIKSAYTNRFYSGTGQVVASDPFLIQPLHMVLVDVDGPQVLTAPWPKESPTAPQSPSAGNVWLDRAVGTWRIFNGSVWEARSVVPIALVVESGGGPPFTTEAYRCLDLSGDYRRDNGVWAERESANVMASGPCKVSVAGTMVFANRLAWDARSSFASGENLRAGRAYLYLDRSGREYIARLDPIWRPELYGRYHRHRDWRCVGEAVLSSATEFATQQYLVNEKYNTSARVPAEASARIRRVSASSASIEPIGDTDGFRPEAGSTTTQVNFEIPFAFAHRGGSDSDPVVDVAPLDPDDTKITRISITKNTGGSRYDVVYNYAAGEGGGTARQDAIVRAHLTGDARLQALVDARTK